MNKNYTSELNINYKMQQQAIKEICEELNLIVFYPDYHADKTDKNTVLIYKQNATENDPYICHFENTDINNNFL